MSDKTNIIDIMVDQQCLDMIGACGNTMVKTPNMDSLREDDILFTNSHPPAALCGPVWTSLFTGRIPAAHGVVRNAAENISNRVKADPLPELPVLSDYLDGYEKYTLGNGI